MVSLVSKMLSIDEMLNCLYFSTQIGYWFSNFQFLLWLMMEKYKTEIISYTQNILING